MECCPTKCKQTVGEAKDLQAQSEISRVGWNLMGELWNSGQETLHRTAGVLNNFTTSLWSV